MIENELIVANSTLQVSKKREYLVKDVHSTRGHFAYVEEDSSQTYSPTVIKGNFSVNHKNVGRKNMPIESQMIDIAKSAQLKAQSELPMNNN
jgi:hypothetical protein